MITKLTLAILKNSGKAGERVRKFLNKSQDEVEDFVANTLLKKDKRSINEIIKEDGKELTRSFHRYVLHPDSDISGETDEVKAICDAVWTDDVKTAWTEFQDAKTGQG